MKKTRQGNPVENWAEQLKDLRPKIASPLGIILGSSRELARLVPGLAGLDITFYQMDLYQAEQVRKELDLQNFAADIRTTPDLWDLPGNFRALIYPVPRGGERALKLAMIEQAYHSLARQGIFIVLSPYENDPLFPQALKKVFKKVHLCRSGETTVLWCFRQGDRPRRRHEITFQVRSEFGRSLRFLSRPGVFCYGRFDDGARALVEIMEIHPGDNVLDLGCGCGTNGIFAGLKSGPEGFTTFVDSNVRGVALTEFNARAMGLEHFQALAQADLKGLPENSFDVVLANPPYFAAESIARMFVEQSRPLLRPGGRFYLVTRQLGPVHQYVEETFGPPEVILHRGYYVLCIPARHGPDGETQG